MRSVYDEVRDFTMVCREGVEFAAQEAVRVARDGVRGPIVECGVWRGGCSMAMLLAQREQYGAVLRPVHLLDSFQGLPPAQPIDGAAALAWQSNSDNCRGPTYSSVMKKLMELGFHEGQDFFIWGGWFHETLPFVARAVGSVSLLRLDGDWFKSTAECLDALAPLVSPMGTVIVDDYYAWDGCARAVHSYVSARGLAVRLRSMPDFSSAYWYAEGQ